MKYLLFSGYVRGWQFYYVKHRCPESMKPGQKVQLLPEPTNPKDKKAIAIYWHSKKLGYLPRQSESILLLIQQKAPLITTINEISANIPRIEVFLWVG